MDTVFTRSVSRDECFDGIICDDQSLARHRDWYTKSLPPPPYARTFRNDFDRDPAHVISYAVVPGNGEGGGDEIWFSKDSANSVGTHAYDVATGAWRKAGDWALPFYGHVQHVPDHGLWFGISNPYGEDTVLCATDLTKTPPTARVVWVDPAPPGWISVSSHLVHLGRSMFCHARFFKISRPDVGCLNFVVFTGLVVERANGGGDELVVVKHRSVRYNVSYSCMKWVL